MLDAEQAIKHARSWIAAWNRHDLDGIMAHYADTVEFWSPLIITRHGLATGQITGKAALRRYFADGLARAPHLTFELHQVLVGVDSVAVYYRRHDGADVAEVAVLDQDGQIVSARVHYWPARTKHRGGEGTPDDTA